MKILLAIICASFHLSANYFSDKHLLTASEQAKALEEQRHMDMCFYFDDVHYLRFETTDKGVYFELNIDASSAELKEKWIAGDDPSSLIFSYYCDHSGNIELNMPKKLVAAHPDGHEYLLCERRVMEGADPTIISSEELAKIIQHHSVLFYTGAGLSRDAGIPAMGQLMESLGIGPGKHFTCLFNEIVLDPGAFGEKIQNFHDACFCTPPSPAHIALKDLTSTWIVTENLDSLHEASGCMPYRIQAEKVRNEIPTEDFKEIDYVICIGLSHDDRGFLAWYKKQHPEGKIIAIDLQQPSYLGNEDMLLVGDLQSIIPDLLTQMN